MPRCSMLKDCLQMQGMPVIAIKKSARLRNHLCNTRLVLDGSQNWHVFCDSFCSETAPGSSKLPLHLGAWQRSHLIQLHSPPDSIFSNPKGLSERI